MRKYIAEIIGTFLLVFIGTLTVTQVPPLASDGVATLIIALGFGIALFIVFVMIGQVSGAHVNPAVSFGAWFRGSLSTHDLVPYWVSQGVGACAGSILVASIVGFDQPIGETTFGAMNPSGALALESVLTFVFVFVFLQVGNSRHTKAALAIAGTLTVAHLAGVSLTGASINPIRSIAPVVVNADPMAASQLWVYVAGPMLGGMLAGLVAKYEKFGRV